MEAELVMKRLSILNFVAGMICMAFFFTIVIFGAALPFYILGPPVYWHHWYCVPGVISIFTLFSIIALVPGYMSIYFFGHESDQSK